MTNEIARPEWAKFFDEISKNFFGWESRVQIFKDDIGAQTLSEGLPFNGFIIDRKSNNGVAVEIMLGEDTSAHQTHTIFHPRKVFFEDQENGGIVEIVDADGAKTLTYFVQPVKVLVEYGETELVAQM